MPRRTEARRLVGDATSGIRHVLYDIDSYNAVVTITIYLSCTLKSLWLTRKHHASIPDTFDSWVIGTRKTSLPHNIRDDVVNAPIGLTQGSLSYANYTQQFNDFLMRSRQPLTDNIQCARFIDGFVNPCTHGMA
jgi:hypothetical protein